ncbi:EAL domain-containing protein [Herbaspirillum huttiense F1]|uniref:EAL domain-containing protein n=2 Tax=Pseudomonadota TaxID=1224 RepID=A0ABU2EP83_9BURK|nr:MULTISPECIES: EAL domain-containing protein [Herbaspirillum]MBP1314596.1 diguanylate cyclase (GGDEF)-like protein [Herbaspirillum sp. 1130]MDR6741745.1 diguanylate cyclase (GGDEF)-like protein [Herbaspirillum sp. 1173]MDR9849984.1 EAL domain-containing protein [Herbaspirillum huttiense SE1]MDT0358676.1 EAL domain-containing protein [Herbaspirillum huttiense F1]
MNELKTETGAGDHASRLALRQLIRADQLTAARHTVMLSIPVAFVLSGISTFVAWHSGKFWVALIWLACATLVNLVRIPLCRLSPQRVAQLVPWMAPRGQVRDASDVVELNLRLHWILALISGFAWAGMPWLSEGYTTPETLFYLTCVCGITAGAVTHGFAFARIPISFITPPLLSVIFCLFAFNRTPTRLALAATAVIYLAGLIRGARVGERMFARACALKNEATTASQALAVAHEDLRQFAARMQYQAEHDLLTGLLDRAGFMQVAAQVLVQQRERQCLMFLDLDGFKVINDAYGHEAGDQVLIEVARRLQAALPEGATLARLGGDEFVILYPLTAHAEPPEHVAQRLIAAMRQPFARLAHRHIGLSLGIYLSRGDDINEMLVCSDAAMYEAKRRGRNQYQVFNAALDAHLQMKRDVERDLAQALADGELQVWFQPIVCEDGRALDGFEALVRWTHRRHGPIAPPDLIEIAALAGLSEELLRFIMGEVAHMIQFMRDNGRSDLRVSMNISPREMERIIIEDLVVGTLKRQNLPAQMLEIEITEETALDLQAATQTLTALALQGVSIAIDDFGVGYSSLGFLRQLHVSRVKIDRSFVTGLADQTENQALVSAVLQLAASFGFQVVAEGVESEEDLQVLQSMHCHAMQGHYFAEPMPAERARQHVLALTPA